MVMPSIQPTQWHIVEASYWQSVYGITWRCHSAKTARWWSHRDVKEPNAVQYCIILYYPKWIQKHVITIFAGLVTFLSGGCYTDYTGDRWLYMAIHGYTWLYITLNMAIHYTKPYYTNRHVRSEVSRWWSVAAAEDTARTERSQLRRRAMALLQRAGEPFDQGSFVNHHH